MKVLLLIVALYGGWRVFGPKGASGGESGAKSASYSSGGSFGAGVSAKSQGPQGSVTRGDVEAAKRKMTQASENLAAIQNSRAGAATQDRQVEYHGDYRYTQTLTYDNSGVNQRSAAIKAAMLEVQEAQKNYAEVYRAWKASGGK